MTDDELAAVIAAVQALIDQSEEPPQAQISAWKRAARLEGLGVQ
jgi:hypothetical protein